MGCARPSPATSSRPRCRPPGHRNPARRKGCRSGDLRYPRGSPRAARRAGPWAGRSRERPEPGRDRPVRCRACLDRRRRAGSAARAPALSDRRPDRSRRRRGGNRHRGRLPAPGPAQAAAATRRRRFSSHRASARGRQRHRSRTAPAIRSRQTKARTSGSTCSRVLADIRTPGTPAPGWVPAPTMNSRSTSSLRLCGRNQALCSSSGSMPKAAPL